MLKSGNGHLAPLIRKVKSLQFFRRESTTLHDFYQNKQLELYASKEAKRLTLRQLVCLPSIQAQISKLILATGLLWSFYE